MELLGECFQIFVSSEVDQTKLILLGLVLIGVHHRDFELVLMVLFNHCLVLRSAGHGRCVQGLTDRVLENNFAPDDLLIISELTSLDRNFPILKVFLLLDRFRNLEFVHIELDDFHEWRLILDNVSFEGHSWGLILLDERSIRVFTFVCLVIRFALSENIGLS